MSDLPRLGVAVVTFNSSDVILDCLESLLASTKVELDIVVADNASTDETIALLCDWAAGRHVHQLAADSPFQTASPRQRNLPLDGSSTSGLAHRITLIRTGVNGGFAAGVNAALAVLQTRSGVDRFWVLNPDSMVPPETAAAFATQPEPEGGFALMGGRVLYLETPEIIQIDGGTLNHWTGVTGNINLGQRHPEAPSPESAAMAFVTGASIVVSRRFYEIAGPMAEDYFLYYEEVDWALRRGHLPLLHCPKAIVYHRAGTAIGSPTPKRPASPFSLYFKHRGRLRFMRRHYPAALPVALLYSAAKAGQLLLKGYPLEAWTILSASLGLPASAAIRERLGPEAAARAFGPAGR